MAKRAIVLIIDGCGAGAAPDAADFADSKACNTLSNVGQKCGPLDLPNFARLGLGNITTIKGVSNNPKAEGLFGKLKELSKGKDTQTGHWEMMGVISNTAFPTYPQGFPTEIINEFIKETGCKEILGNRTASGTEILDQLGYEHQVTGYPIVYTSADSVFQIAAHVKTVPLEKLYRWCEIARKILQGLHRVGRVIARPFEGEPGEYKRLQGDRRDYGVPPPKPTFLDLLHQCKLGVLGIGKIEDIFCGHGLTYAKHTGINSEGLALTLEAIKGELNLDQMKINGNATNGVALIFTNLVDTDSMYGHRRNAQGYADALREIDQSLGAILKAMSQEDLLLITSDHGNDPTMPGSDHTREYVPLLIYSPSFTNGGKIASTYDLGTRESFADVAATLATWLGVTWPGPGKSCLLQK